LQNHPIGHIWQGFLDEAIFKNIAKKNIWNKKQNKTRGIKS
jgi:hypothetical protein